MRGGVLTRLCDTDDGDGDNVVLVDCSYDRDPDCVDAAADDDNYCCACDHDASVDDAGAHIDVTVDFHCGLASDRGDVNYNVVDVGCLSCQMPAPLSPSGVAVKEVYEVLRILGFNR